MELTFRPASEGDVSSLLEIEEKTFLDPWKEKDLLYEIRENPYSTFRIVLADGKIAGFIVYWITFESATLCQIAVSPECRRQGIAERLMKDMYEDCYSRRVDDITLEVRESNDAAKSLYRKCGYREVCIKKNYYKNGENAVYMMKEMIAL